MLKQWRQRRKLKKIIGFMGVSSLLTGLCWGIWFFSFVIIIITRYLANTLERKSTIASGERKPFLNGRINNNGYLCEGAHNAIVSLWGPFYEARMRPCSLCMLFALHKNTSDTMHRRLKALRDIQAVIFCLRWMDVHMEPHFIATCGSICSNVI